MAAFLIPPLKFKWTYPDGTALVGGKVYTYVAGTSTPKATYVNFEKTPNLNPIILDANGEANIRIEAGYYKFVIKDANDVVIHTEDKVGLPSNSDAGVPTGGDAGQVLAKITDDDYNYDWVSLQYINETSFTIVNGQASPADVTGLVFDKTVVGSAIITYWIKRRTTSTGATNLVEAGMMLATYDIDTETWSLTSLGAGPNFAQVYFTITSAGQVQYTSESITGTAGTSKMKFKATSMGV